MIRERGKEGEKEGENHWCERKTLIGCLSHAPWLRAEPTTQACALIRNQTRDLLVYGTTLQPTKPEARPQNSVLYWKLYGARSRPLVRAISAKFISSLEKFKLWDHKGFLPFLHICNFGTNATSLECGQDVGKMFGLSGQCWGSN